MTRFTKTCSLFALIVTLAVGLSAPAMATALVGTYDADPDDNDVDQSAAFSSGTGGATAANVTDVATFSASVSAAFLANNGGVLDFESALNADDNVPTTGVSSPATLEFGGGKEVSLGIASVGGATTNGFDLLRAAGITNRTEISGTHQLATAGGNGIGTTGIDLTIGAVTNGATNEAVTQFGVTFLGRLSRTVDVSVVATFSGGGTATATETTIGAGNDTFYGFIAPTGESITAVSISASNWNTGNAESFSIDDIGIVTAVVPEPASLALVGLGGLMLLRRQR